MAMFGASFALLPMFSEPSGLMNDVRPVVSFSGSDGPFSSLPLEGDSVAEGHPYLFFPPVDELQDKLIAVIRKADLLAIGDIEPERDRLGAFRRRVHRST